MRLACLFFALALILFAEGVAGTYKGTFSGSAGESGDILVTLKQADSGEWKSEVTFNLNGQDFKTKVTSVNVDGSKVKKSSTNSILTAQVSSLLSPAS